jgi:hypothetical protein
VGETESPRFVAASFDIVDRLAEVHGMSPEESVFLLVVTAAQVSAFAGIDSNDVVGTFIKSYAALSSTTTKDKRVCD